MSESVIVERVANAYMEQDRKNGYHGIADWRYVQDVRSVLAAIGRAGYRVIEAIDGEAEPRSEER